MKALYPVAKVCPAAGGATSGGSGSAAEDAAAAGGGVPAGIGSEVTGCDRAVAVAHPAIAIARRIVSAIPGLRCNSTRIVVSVPINTLQLGSVVTRTSRRRGGPGSENRRHSAPTTALFK